MEVTKELKEKNGLKASQKRKLKEIRRKLSDIAEVVESIAMEEEKHIDFLNSDDENNFSHEKELLHIENLYASVKAIEASVLLIDSTLE
jgi:hypothetical protein